MIVGKQHRYVYVELPRTGSTAVAKELIASYGGERILEKHSTLRDWHAIADDDQRSWFAFSNIRNPLDDAVSRYFKMQSDHHGRFSDPIRRKYRVGNRGADAMRATGLDARGEKPERRSVFERLENLRQDFIVRNDADFPAFFRRYYWLPYDNWSRLSHADLDHVIRFEEIQTGFRAALERIGVGQIRELPVTNRTEARDRTFESYYSPEIIDRARFVFGPYMRRWGYEFPQSWPGDDRRDLAADALYRALAVPRELYWRRPRRG